MYFQKIGHNKSFLLDFDKRRSTKCFVFIATMNHRFKKIDCLHFESYHQIIFSLLSARGLSYLVHGEGHIFINEGLVIVCMYLHKDSIGYILIVVNLQESSPWHEGRGSTANQTLPGANIENLQ